MNKLRIRLIELSNKKELVLLATTLLLLILAFSSKKLEVENNSIPITFLFLFFSSLGYYILLTIIKEEDKLLKVSLTIYLIYLISRGIKLVANYIDALFWMRVFANIFSIMYWLAMLLFVVCLLKIFINQSFSTKILVGFSALCLALDLVKKYFKLDIALNSYGLNEHLFLLFSTITLSFAIITSMIRPSIGIKAVNVILFVQCVYVFLFKYFGA